MDGFRRACASKGKEEEGGKLNSFCRIYRPRKESLSIRDLAFEGWLSRISRLDVGIRENTTV